MDDPSARIDVLSQLRQFGVDGGTVLVGDQRWIIRVESLSAAVPQTAPGEHQVQLTLNGPYGRRRRARIFLDERTAHERGRMEHIVKALAEWLPNSDAAEVFTGRF